MQVVKLKRLQLLLLVSRFLEAQVLDTTLATMDGVEVETQPSMSIVVSHIDLTTPLVAVTHSL
jgi:hypothetical protein